MAWNDADDARVSDEVVDDGVSEEVVGDVALSSVTFPVDGDVAWRRWHAAGETEDVAFVSGDTDDVRDAPRRQHMEWGNVGTKGKRMKTLLPSI